MSEPTKVVEQPKPTAPVRMTRIAARREIKKLDEGELKECRTKLLDIKTIGEEREKAKRLANVLLDRRLELMNARDEKKVK